MGVVEQNIMSHNWHQKFRYILFLQHSTCNNPHGSRKICSKTSPIFSVTVCRNWKQASSLAFDCKLGDLLLLFTNANQTFHSILFCTRRERRPLCYRTSAIFFSQSFLGLRSHPTPNGTPLRARAASCKSLQAKRWRRGAKSFCIPEYRYLSRLDSASKWLELWTYLEDAVGNVLFIFRTLNGPDLMKRQAKTILSCWVLRSSQYSCPSSIRTRFEPQI